MKRLGLLTATLLATGTLLVVTTTSAWAHRPQVSGVASCPGADHVIDWTIGNNLKKQPMTIMSADAVLDSNSTSYAVTGYSTGPIDEGTPTHATTTIPGNLTGTVTLTVVGHWPDGITNPAKGSVTLDTPCTTTTTTSPTTTTPPTTAPPTTTPGSTTPPTTAVSPPTTSMSGGQTCNGPTGTDTAGSCLAFTAGGTHARPFVALGITLILLGLAGMAALGFGANRRRRLYGQ